MLKKTRFKFIFLVFVIISAILAVHAYLNKTGWFFDQFTAIVIMFFAFLLRKKLKITLFSYYLLAIALLLHDAGTFGFYNISPVSIQYDHITHFLGYFALTFIFYNFLSKNMEFSWFEAMLFSFLVVMGIGAVLEVWEFIAHLTRNNFLAGLVLDKTDQSREWTNMMIDLVYNGIGCLAAILVKQLKALSMRFHNRLRHFLHQQCLIITSFL